MTAISFAFGVIVGGLFYLSAKHEARKYKLLSEIYLKAFTEIGNYRSSIKGQVNAKQ